MLDINNVNTKDKKLKFDHTIDVICVLNLTCFVKKKEDGNYLSMQLYTFKDKSKEIITNLDIKITEFVDIDYNLLSIKFFIDNSWCIMPPVFICEYSFITNSIHTPRMDKTDKFFIKGYLGNNYKVVNYIRQNHEDGTFATIELLTKLSENFNIEQLGITDDKNEQLLNKNIPFYYKEQEQRPSFNIECNFIKTNLINLLQKNVLRNKHLISVLSIDCGRGGDLNRYYYLDNVGAFVATDKFSENISKFNNRISDLRKKDRMFNVVSIQTHILYEDFFEKIFSKKGKIVFDVIEWNFAIHYSWSDKNKFNIMNKLKMLSKQNTIVIITCLNGEKVRKLFSDGVFEHKFRTDLDNSSPYVTITKKSEEIIEVFYNTTMIEPLEEYIVDPIDLISTFEDNGFIMRINGSFDTAFSKEYETMLTFNLPESTNNFFLLLYKLSKIEPDPSYKQLKNLYHYYIFQSIK